MSISDPPVSVGHGRLHLVPLLIAAVFFLAGNEDFGFDSAGSLDSFMHLGYFWHYPAHLPGLDHDYKASRLPWILPGYLFHWLGDPAAASIVLVFATLSAGGVALCFQTSPLHRLAMGAARPSSCRPSRRLPVAVAHRNLSVAANGQKA